MDKKKLFAYKMKYETAQKVFEQDYFNLAICEVLLGDFPKANEHFSQAMEMVIKPNSYWRSSAQPNWFVDIAILSGKSDYFPLVQEELAIYRVTPSRAGPIGSSPMAHYCYCVMGLLCDNLDNIQEWIKDLKKRQKYKDMIATGLTLEAILNRDQESFTHSIQLLLDAHKGMAKYGQLRISPEGWLCLPAMTLSFLACKKNLIVSVENEYLSLGYLEYLLGR